MGAASRSFRSSERKKVDSDVTRAGSPERPASDVAVLTEIAERLGVLAG